MRQPRRTAQKKHCETQWNILQYSSEQNALVPLIILLHAAEVSRFAWPFQLDPDCNLNIYKGLPWNWAHLWYPRLSRTLFEKLKGLTSQQLVIWPEWDDRWKNDESGCFTKARASEEITGVATYRTSCAAKIRRKQCRFTNPWKLPWRRRIGSGPSTRFSSAVKEKNETASIIWTFKGFNVANW